MPDSEEAIPLKESVTDRIVKMVRKRKVTRKRKTGRVVKRRIRKKQTGGRRTYKARNITRRRQTGRGRRRKKTCRKKDIF